jgi:hypothetical protein
VGQAPVRLGAATRPCPGETENGDRWIVHHHAGVARIAVIDGLGHGAPAAQAAEAALAALARRPELSPVDGLRICHEPLRGTRGAAISLVSIDAAAQRLVYSGVGNVEAHLWRGGRWERPITYRGIVGVTLPTVRAFDFVLGAAWLLILHTDGLSARLELDDPAEALGRDPADLADDLLRRWARDHDDATVVVACSELAEVRPSA